MHVFLVRILSHSNVLSVSINKKTFKTPSTCHLNRPGSYFKVGSCNQGDTSTEVHIFNVRLCRRL
ncbi:hypothetical protein V8C43DRAFT_291196 [Trichoderma afarasin]